METNNNNTPLGQSEEGGINILELWHLIWHHKIWYILSVAICLTAAAFYLYRKIGRASCRERV